MRRLQKFVVFFCFCICSGHTNITKKTMARETQFQCWEPYNRQRSEKRTILDYCNCYYHWIFHSAGFLCQREKASNWVSRTKELKTQSPKSSNSNRIVQFQLDEFENKSLGNVITAWKNNQWRDWGDVKNWLIFLSVFLGHWPAQIFQGNFWNLEGPH